MTDDQADNGGKRQPANDNCPPDGQASGSEADASARLNAVVLSIARLIGRQLAREHFEALRAANDNAPFIVRKDSEDGSPGSNNEE